MLFIALGMSFAYVQSLMFSNELVFNIIPFENKVVDVDYITDTDKRINIYSNLSLEKGKTFTSTMLEISDPVGLDKLIILENGNVILEQNILVKKMKR